MNFYNPLTLEETGIGLLSREIEGQCLKMIIAISIKFKLMTSQGCKDDYKVNSKKIFFTGGAGTHPDNWNYLVLTPGCIENLTGNCKFYPASKMLNCDRGRRFERIEPWRGSFL
jgi:hypothetical protein